MNNFLSTFQTSHAILVGINDYQNVNPLLNAINDINGIEEVLNASEVHNYKIHKLENPTFNELVHLLEEHLPKIVQKKDRLLFYFAGHGIAEASKQDGIPEGYLLPVDVLKDNKSKSLSMTRLYKALDRLPCHHVLIILDCCFSGAFRWVGTQKRGLNLYPSTIYKGRAARFIKDPAWQVITSSSYDQEAIDSIYNNPIGTSRNNSTSSFSPFASLFMEAIKGAADLPKERPDGLITATDIYVYIRNILEPDTIKLGDRYRQTPGIFNLPRHDKGEYLFLSPKMKLNLPDFDPKRNPYKGLHSYEPTDADLYFGREKVVEELFQKIESQKIAIVTGASGTGKSSLVKAGIISKFDPALVAYYVMRPGKKPMEYLSNWLPDLSAPKGVKAILIIDQFEELITQCYDLATRKAFLKTLLQLTKSKEDIKIIITVRSDFEPQFEKGILAPVWKSNRFVVPPLSSSELQEIIEKPANERAIIFEPEDLVQTIIQDIQNAPGALPLLSFTMSEMYEKLKEGGSFSVFKQADYIEIGGVIGALGKRANDIYDDLKQKGSTYQETMKKIMLRMVSFEGEELARRRVSKEELEFNNKEENERVKYITEKLIAARLIIRGDSAKEYEVAREDREAEAFDYFEPAHDALIRAWDSLWKWITDIGKEKLLLFSKLQNATQDYYQSESPNTKDLWHRNPRLDAVKGEGNWLNKKEKAFIDKSIIQKNWLRNLTIGLTAIIIIALSSLSIYAFQERNKATRRLFESDMNSITSAQQRGDYKEALALLDTLEEVILSIDKRLWSEKSEEVEARLKEIDSISTYVAKGDSLRVDSQMVEAINFYEQALRFSRDPIIEQKQAEAKRLRGLLFEDYFLKANQMLAFGEECFFADENYKKAAALKMNSSEEQRLDSLFNSILLKCSNKINGINEDR